MRQVWLRALHRADPLSKRPWQPTKYSAVCSKHFLPSDFIVNRGYTLLKSSAVPSVNLCLPQHLVKIARNVQVGPVSMLHPPFAPHHQVLLRLLTWTPGNVITVTVCSHHRRLRKDTMNSWSVLRHSGDSFTMPTDVKRQQNEQWSNW